MPVILVNWWFTRRAQRACMHHDRRAGKTWITERLIQNGMGKMFWCQHCGQTWFV